MEANNPNYLQWLCKNGEIKVEGNLFSETSVICISDFYNKNILYHH